MQKILRPRFGVDTVCPSMRLIRDGQHLEIDVPALCGAINAAYVVEVKSRLQEKDIEQLSKASKAMSSAVAHSNPNKSRA